MKKLYWDCDNCWVETEHKPKYNKDAEVVACCKECDHINWLHMKNEIFTKI